MLQENPVNQNNKMRIFITTDLSKLESSVFPKFDPETYKGIDNLGTNPILYLDSNENEFSSETISNAQIILIHDITYIESIKLFEINSESDYLLHHNIPENIIYSGFKDKIQGQHELHDLKYPPTFKIIFDDTIENKAEEIIKLLFKVAKTEDGSFSDSEQNAQKAFETATKSMTLAYFKNHSNNVFNTELYIAQDNLEKVLKYIKTTEYKSNKLKESKKIIDNSEILDDIAKIYSESDNIRKKEAFLEMMANFQKLSREMENALFNEDKE